MGRDGSRPAPRERAGLVGVISSPARDNRTPTETLPDLQAEKVRFMLGGYFSEVYDLLANVDHHLFVAEFVWLAKEYRTHRPAEERP